uniref:Complement component C8 beta chain n=1 Tax=Chimaera phantasma TaxID=134990 RepID=D0FYI7_9CHON|nr:complement component C8 beta subunit precursor [Chimaera phantasma]
MGSCGLFRSVSCVALLLTVADIGQSCGPSEDSPTVSGGQSRWRRSPRDPPQPLDCVLSAWSAWSQCEPCQGKRFRYARLEVPRQFGGEPCDMFDHQEEACTPRRHCREPDICEGFVCAETGRCIPRRLLCNGDDDCGDRSDEKDCRRTQVACSGHREQYWGVQHLGSGFNILTESLEGPVLDNRYYAGSCAPHYIKNVRFRKPHNLDLHNPETKADYQFSLQKYDSYSSFNENRFKTSEKSVSFKLELKIPDIFEIGVNYENNNYRKMASRFLDSSGSKRSMYHAQMTLQVGRFQFKPRDLMLHHEFFRRISELPTTYNYGEYREIYKDYGTHFMSEGLLGGTYEYLWVLNSTQMEKDGYSLSDAANAMKVGAHLGGSINGVYVSGGFNYGQADKRLKEKGVGIASSKYTEDFIVFVRGGASQHVTALSHKDPPTEQLMQEWGEAVEYSPEVIKFKPLPLYQLVTGQTFYNSRAIKANMKRALDEFLTEYSLCRCAPCHNNGAVFFTGTHCGCVCPPGFRGFACEITNRRDVSVDGKWTCWSGWSECTGRRKTRTRSCNNPPPAHGGLPCHGDVQETLTGYC